MIRTLTAVLGLLSVSCSVAVRWDIYVSAADGSDGRDGSSRSRALQTIQRAVEMIRQGRTQSQEEVFVHIVGGPGAVYDFSEGPLVLTGSKFANVTFHGEFSKGPELPVLSAGIVVKPEAWSAGSEGALSAELRLADGSQLPARLDTVFVHGSLGLPVQHVSLGAHRNRPRTAMLNWTEPLVPAPWSVMSKENCSGNNENCFGFVPGANQINSSWSRSPESLKQWTVAAFHSWTKAYHSVQKVGSDVLRFGEKASFPYGKFEYCSKHRYYIENIPELPLEAGQFRLQGAILTYKPLDMNEKKGLLDGSLILVAPASEQIFAVNNKASVRFQSLAFSHSRSVCGSAPACDQSNAGGVSSMIGASHADLVVENCTLAHSVGNAVSAQAPGIFHVSSSLFADLGAGAVDVSYASQPVMVSDNNVLGFGLRHPDAPGIHVVGSPQSIVSHNDVSLGWSNGLQISSQNDAGAGTLVEFNHIHSNGREDESGICDYGAIHVGAAYSKKHIFIRNNIFRNITAFANGGEGIYLDTASSAVSVQQNLVYDVLSQPFKWGGGHPLPVDAAPLIVSNNIFVSNRSNAFYRERRLDANDGLIDWDGYVRASFDHNVVVAQLPENAKHGDGSAVRFWFEGKPCATQWNPSTVATLCTNRLVDNFKVANIHSNMYFNASGQGNHGFPDNTNKASVGNFTWQEWQKSSGEHNSLFDVDPEFRNAKAGDSVIRSEKATHDLGIKPLDLLNKVGASWQPTIVAGNRPAPHAMVV